MAYSKVLQYYNCIEPLSAEERLLDIKVSAYPQMKKQSRSQLEKELQRRSKTNFRPKKSKLSTEEIYHDLLRKLGNG